MRDTPRLLDARCRACRETLHRRLDGDSLGSEEARRLDEHLAACAECRDFGDDLAAIQRGLGELEGGELSAEALEQVWDRTTRLEAGGAVSAPASAWRMAAAAAVIGLALLGAWLQGRPTAETPTDAELARAAIEAKAVLKLTANALHRTERVALQEVLRSEVSQALRRAPVAWPGRESPEGGKSGT